MTQLSNQFGITNEVGSLTLLQNNNIIDAIVDASEAGTLVPGNAVLIKDVASKKTKIELATALTDAFFGFIPFDVRVASYTANDITKVVFNDCVMIMEASAAIAAGAEIQFDPSTNKVATQVAPNTKIGYALDKATADGDLINVLIKTPGAAEQDLSGLTATVAELNILDGATVVTAEVNYNDLTTGPGTQEALKSVVADANVNTGISKVTELHIGATGAEVQVTSTPAELNILDGATLTLAELNKLDTSAETESITAAGATDAAKRISTLDLPGAGAVTLAVPDASMLGLTKVIEMTTDNGDVTLALTNVQGGSAATTCTWANVGEALVLVAGIAKWNVVSEGGVVLS